MGSVWGGFCWRFLPPAGLLLPCWRWEHATLHRPPPTCLLYFHPDSWNIVPVASVLSLFIFSLTFSLSWRTDMFFSSPGSSSLFCLSLAHSRWSFFLQSSPHFLLLSVFFQIVMFHFCLSHFFHFPLLHVWLWYLCVLIYYTTVSHPLHQIPNECCYQFLKWNKRGVNPLNQPFGGLICTQ